MWRMNDIWLDIVRHVCISWIMINIYNSFLSYCFNLFQSSRFACDLSTTLTVGSRSPPTTPLTLPSSRSILRILELSLSATTKCGVTTIGFGPFLSTFAVEMETWKYDITPWVLSDAWLKRETRLSNDSVTNLAKGLMSRLVNKERYFLDGTTRPCVRLSKENVVKVHVKLKIRCYGYFCSMTFGVISTENGDIS